MRPGSAKVDREFSIKTNTTKGDKEQMIKLRRKNSKQSEAFGIDDDDTDQLESIELPDKPEQIATIKSSPAQPKEPDFEKIEKIWAAQDKYRLMAWGLKQK